MTSTQVRINARVNAAEVRSALQGLPANVQLAVLKRGMRRALAPMEKALEAAWKGAPYRGRPMHRRAIAAATKTDVRRAGGRGAVQVMGRVGVKYGAGGGVAARGRQKIWHLLEGGFKHYARSSAYKNFSAAARADLDGYREVVRRERAAVFSRGLPKQARAQAMRGVYAAAREQFPVLVGERQDRAKERKRSPSRAVPGSWRSKRVVQRNLDATMKLLRQEILRAAREGLTGRRRGRIA